MKQSNHNDVDLLLRSLARVEEEKAWTDENSFSATAMDHLDADELNLYAEGVLPPPARARYTKHLADCQSCRTLVAGLAQSAGHTVRQDATPQQSGVKFWHSLATLFSLPVLRYALPALALTGVVALGLLALRDQRGSDLVAVNQKAKPATALDRPSENLADSGIAAPSPVLQRQGTDSNTASNEPKNSPGDNSGLLAQRRDSTIGGITTDGTAAKDVAESPQVTGGWASQPVYAPEPAPPPKVSSEEVAKAAARKENLYESESMNRRQEELKLLSKSKDDSQTHGPARSRTMSGGSRREADSPAENRAAADKAKKEVAEEVQMRTVSGRRFRRQGNAWVDTAYEGSRGATNVGRGSEQFRALMADEPGLRAVVQQLGGEVVVVWKNRAYRIR